MVCSNKQTEPAVPMSKRARLEGTWLELQRLRPDARTFHPCLADLRGGSHCREMLGLEAGLRAVRADVREPDRPPLDDRQGQRTAEDLPAAFTEGCIQFDHDCPMLARSRSAARIGPNGTVYRRKRLVCAAGSGVRRRS